TEANGWSQTVTVPRLSAQGHTFTIKEIAVPGFSSTYETPATKDTDGDGVVDTITYVINNTYVMPQITVSGDIAWDKVPDGMTEPDMTVNLVLNDTVIDSVTVSAGVASYSFDELDRYDDEGNVLAYTVEVEDIADYDAVTTAPATDADGNIDIDITATGTFSYGALTISSTVTGEDAPADAEFTYTVTFDSTVSYPCTGSAAGTIKSGDKITLKNGESITISDVLVGVKFTVTQDEAESFVTSPASRKIEGVISAAPSVAAFSNAYNPPVVTGNLQITNKVTGENADTSLRFSFKVEFDAEGSYELRIYGAGETVPASGSTGMLGRLSITAAGARATTGTIKSGDTIQLAHGETAVIYGLPVGTAYKVTETENKAYRLTSTGASGTVSQDGAKASFINEKIKSSSGSEGPKTGDYSSDNGAAIVVMQVAMLAMLLCVFCMKKLRAQDESEQF
ncbi:MAG: Cna B-type domain-containing protein, partial [Ruminococcaceae bacterium]|nr:Cna B-type domain-containing protein [Oscillospiraceae bacterium]